jgi:hypothetical protein
MIPPSRAVYVGTRTGISRPRAVDSAPEWIESQIQTADADFLRTRRRRPHRDRDRGGTADRRRRLRLRHRTTARGGAHRRQRHRAAQPDAGRRLAEFNPHLAGAVLNGTATEHSDIHLQLFAESAKDVEMFLLNEGVAFDVAEGDNSPGGSEETIHFVVKPARSRGMPARVGVRLAVHDVDGVRVAPRHRSADTTLHRVEQLGRANLKSVRELVADIAAKAGKATDGT